MISAVADFGKISSFVSSDDCSHVVPGSSDDSSMHVLRVVPVWLAVFVTSLCSGLPDAFDISITNGVGNAIDLLTGVISPAAQPRTKINFSSVERMHLKCTTLIKNATTVFVPVSSR